MHGATHTDGPRFHGPIRDAWGRTLVPQGCVLPPYCVSCGRPRHGNTPNFLERSFIDTLVFIAGAFLGLLGALLVHHMMRKSARLVGHICPACEAQLAAARRRSRLLIHASLYTLVGACVMPVVMVILGLVLLAPAAFMLAWLSVFLLSGLHFVLLFGAALSLSTEPLRVTKVQEQVGPTGPGVVLLELKDLHPNILLPG